MFVRPATLLGPVPTNVDAVTAPVQCGNLQNVRFQVKAANTSTPISVFKLQGSDDPQVSFDIRKGIAGTVNETAQWTDITMPAGSVHGTNASFTFTGPAVTAGWDGTIAMNAIFNVQNPSAYMRLVFDNTSGGSAVASLIVKVSARGNAG